MPSVALAAFLAATSEIVDLATPSAGGRALAPSLKWLRAAGRARTVLLSSHFERYFYAVNEEAITHLNSSHTLAAQLPLKFRLLHSKEPLDLAAGMSWENRETKLVDLVAQDGWLWNATLAGTLSHSRLLSWMTAPKPQNLVRYYKYWSIEDIFSAITRSQLARTRLWLGVQELVDKRNNIAHGDYTAQATSVDLTRYMSTSRIFCERADRRLAQAIASITKGPKPW